MSIYTRSGDRGRTRLVGGVRDKDDIRVEAYGTVDEANAFVGEAISRLDPVRDGDLAGHLLEIQQELFDCGADLAALPGKRPYKVHAEMINRLEPLIDSYLAEARPVERFILPGGHPAAAALHVCRVLVRRAERRVVTLSQREEINPEVLRYLNRLSDFFFAAARAINARTGTGDIEYVRSPIVFRNSGGQNPSNPKLNTPDDPGGNA
ncbi:MAG: cob(I)yrinic acid a,c-diamide adenosyltransferase [Kyrpidia tusciae]|nr:cob(I)yrinic acid a,c-diamide adenosyltransferase [Kyrpidia tusciae]MBE3551924.1 cob(I)yrinic acid a,c-diamide adenosyltransferase [Kyrpidia tusciae]